MEVTVSREKQVQRANEVATFFAERRLLTGNLAKEGKSLSETVFLTKDYGVDPISAAPKTRKGDDKPGPTNQGFLYGPKPQPFDFDAVLRLLNSNIHHSRCIHTKSKATVGLGFKADKVKKALNPLCDMTSFQFLLNAISLDYWQTGNAYLEVVRNDPDNPKRITGLHRIPTSDVVVVLEDNLGNYHYRIQGNEQSWLKFFARYGDREDYMLRAKGNMNPQPFAAPVLPMDGRLSEIIHFKMATSQSRWYGWPDSLASVAAIELHQCMQQHTFDFFNNRGVPELMLFVLGAKLSDEDWKAVTTAMKGQIGLGNSHKSMALNIADPNVKIDLHKLALEGKTDGTFSQLDESLALAIVSCHGVPPLLAGIVIPGRLGSANELPNALTGFQVLTVGPAQMEISEALDVTLGNPELNGGLGLNAGDFELRDILEKLDVGKMDTISRMREPLAAAQAGGRDPNAGLFSSGRDRKQMANELHSLNPTP